MSAIYAEGRENTKEVEARGVDLEIGHGKNPWDLNPELAAKVKSYYETPRYRFGRSSALILQRQSPMHCWSARCPRTRRTILPIRKREKS